MSSANAVELTTFSLGTPDFYLFTDPKTLSSEDFYQLFLKWKAAVPYWNGHKGMSHRELAQFVLHFVNGRLFIGSSDREWMFVDEKEIIESSLVYDRAFNLVSGWLKVAEGKLLSRYTQEKKSDSAENSPDLNESKPPEEIKWIKSAINALDSGRSSEGLSSMLKKEMLYGAGKSGHGQMKPDEKAVKVIDSKTGRLAAHIYNFTTMSLRRATSQDDISCIDGINFPVNLTPASEERVKNSKTYAMFCNMFRDYEKVEEEIRLFWRFLSEGFVLGNDDEIIMNWEGKSGTGKSAVENSIHLLLGAKEAISIEAKVYEYKTAERQYQRADLEKKRIAFIPEYGKYQVFNCDELKKDTSFVISARNAALRPVNFRRTHLLVLTGNHPLKLNTLIGAERRFFHVLTAGVSVYPHLNQPGEKPLPMEKMTEIMTGEELDVFLTLISWGRQDRLKYGLEIPLAHSFAMQSNALAMCPQTYQDYMEYALAVGDVKLDPDKEFDGKELYERYEEWFIYVNRGNKNRKPDKSVFGRQFTSVLFGKPRDSNGKRLYKGLDLREITTYQFEQAEGSNKKMMFVDKEKKRGSK